MSARVLVCLIATACLISAIPAVAFYSDEYFSVVHVEEIVGDDGKITFTGEALNITEFQAVQPSHVFVTLKLQGEVLAVISGSPDIYEHIQPGQICPFTIETDFEQWQYDEFSIRFAGYAGLPNPDTESLNGGLVLVEESLNFTTFDADSTAVVLGELYNDSNGILTNITLEFRLFKDEDCLVGVATLGQPRDPGSMWYQNITPGSTIGFIAYSDAPLGKVNRWEYSLSYDLVKFAPVPEDTAIEGASWGQIKAMGR